VPRALSRAAISPVLLIHCCGDCASLHLFIDAGPVGMVCGDLVGKERKGLALVALLREERRALAGSAVGSSRAFGSC
jgi:hypothetical protein